MIKFKESKTAENLLKSFAGESQARMRYTYYADKAQEEGFLQIAEIFIETANNETEHAKLFYNHLIKNGMNEEKLEIHAGYPIALSDRTLDNLGYAAAGEHEEWSELYSTYADVADKEGYPEIAKTFRNVSQVEKRHEERYLKLKKNVQEHKVFKKDGKVYWKCRRCGYIVESIMAPPKCPVCQYEQKYFEVWKPNY